MSSIASQQKTKNGPRVFIGYVKYFNFLAQGPRTFFGEHPKEGNIYRIVETVTPKEYRIYIGKDSQSHIDGLVLGQELKGFFPEKWEFEIVEVDKNNILDLNLDSENLRKLDVWNTTNNEDLWKLLEKPPVVQRITDTDIAKLVAPPDDEIEAIIRKALEEISDRDEETEETGAMLSPQLENDIYSMGATDFNTILRNDKHMAMVICGLLRHIAMKYDEKSPYEDIYKLLQNILKQK